MKDTLKCLKHPEKECYAKVINKDCSEQQACLKIFTTVCEE